MLSLTNKQDVIANNLANANTPGFKKDYISITSFPEQLVSASESYSASRRTERPVGYISPGVGIGETGFINSNGVIRETGGTFDLALSGEGFFAVRSPQGEVYTRNGSFSKDSLGRLVSQDGYLVLGEKGPINVGNGKVAIDVAGRVEINGTYVDTLKVRRFATGDLAKQGSNTFVAHATGQTATSFTVRQGFLEGSNVDTTSELVDMTTTLGAYEANQRVLKTQDEILGKAVNEVGRIS
jgi:flagellar basal-body rod protein FlgG